MSKTDETRIRIGGKEYTLSGNESAEYMQQVADFINGKINEFQNSAAYWSLPMETRSIMLELNLADDYLKARDELALMREQMEEARQLLKDSHQLLAKGRAVSEEEQKRLQEQLNSMVSGYESRLSSSVAFYEEKLAASRRQNEEQIEAGQRENERLTEELSDALAERDAARAALSEAKKQVEALAKAFRKLGVETA